MEWKRYDKDGNIIYEIKNGIKILNEYNNGRNMGSNSIKNKNKKGNKVKIIKMFIKIKSILILLLINIHI